MFDDFPDILTVKDVMYLLDFGKNKVYELLKDGTLKGKQVGKCWRISKDSLKQFLES